MLEPSIGNTRVFQVDGTLAARARFAVGDLPGDLLAGDFNGDGRTDLAAANAISGDVTVLLGGWNGTFAPQARFAVGDFPHRAASIDWVGWAELDTRHEHAVQR